MRHFKSIIVASALMGTILTGGTAFATTYEGYTQEEFEALEQTTVIPSEDSPTGYYVTFRYKDADATRVRIYGEWKFSDIEHATYYTSLNALPNEWKDGMVAWQTDGWPTADMEFNEETGVWSYTIPLPTGTWAYRYYVDGVEGAELTDYTDAKMVADPAQVNYLADGADLENLTEEQALTCVYVPYNEEKQGKTIERAEEAPRNGENGTVVYETVTATEGFETTYGIYLPYNFDPEREEKYPLFILYHGGGGYYGSWFTNGLANILDNMIAEGRLEPTIVVTPNCDNHDYDNDEEYQWARESLMDLVINKIIPNMEENYNTSSDPSKLAFGGLSLGGATAAYAMFHYTDYFDTFIMLSSPVSGDINLDYGKEELKDKTIFFGYGDFDFVASRSIYKQAMDDDGNAVPVAPTFNEGSIFEYFYGLSEAGVEFTSINYPYGHDWILWRKLIVNVFDMLWK